MSLLLTRADKLAINEAKIIGKKGTIAQVTLRAGKNRYNVEYRFGQGEKRIDISSPKKIVLEDVNDMLARFGFRGQLTTLDTHMTPLLIAEVRASAATIKEPINAEAALAV